MVYDVRGDWMRPAQFIRRSGGKGQYVEAAIARNISLLCIISSRYTGFSQFSWDFDTRKRKIPIEFLLEPRGDAYRHW